MASSGGGPGGLSVLGSAHARALERARASALSGSSVCATRSCWVVSPLLTPAATNALHAPRFTSNTRCTHVVQTRYNTLDVYAVEWRAPEAEAPAFSLRLVAEPTPPVLGCILQSALLPQPHCGGTRDLLLVTSSSGFLSLLSFSAPAGSSQPTLQPLGHVRIGTAARGGLGVGRRNMGCFLRVSDRAHAIAVASVEAVCTHRRPREPTAIISASATAPAEEDEIEVPAEGGILVFPITPPTESLGATPAAFASASTAAPALPNLQAPISISLHGTITALLFLPHRSASLRATHTRLLVALVPHPGTISAATSSMRDGVEQLQPAAYPSATHTSRGTPQLLMFDVSLTDGTVEQSTYPTAFQAGDVISDMILVNPKSASAAAPASASAPPSGEPCFVLLQLDGGVRLLDVDSQSTMQFPVTIPLPTWPSEEGDTSSILTTKSAPRIACWSWIGERLVGVNEAGEVHFLSFWWNRPGLKSMPPTGSGEANWMRFVSLGLANPASCLVGLSTPQDVSGLVTPTDFVLLAGDQADDMIARIDWTGVDQELADAQMRQSPDAMQIDIDTAPAVTTSLMPLESALHRQAQTLPNLSELHDFVAANATRAPGVAFPAAHGQLFMLCGRGAHGSLRVARPGTIQAELNASMPADSKVYHGMIALKLPGASTACALLSSFFGSSRLSALRNGELEDISQDLASAGFEANRTTLDAAFTRDARVLLQVDDRCVRAVCVTIVGTGELTGLPSSSPTVWQPPASMANMPPTPSHMSAFTLAVIHGDLILLSLSASCAVVLLQHQAGPSSAGRFIVLAEAQLASAASCLHIAPVRGSALGAPNVASDLMFFVGTHDAQVHLFKLNQVSKLALHHSFRLVDLVKTGESSALVAESVLLCSTLTQGPPSRSSLAATPPRFQLYIGVRDGTLLRCQFQPHGPIDDILTQPLVRRFGAAPLKLARMENRGGPECILAMTDQTHMIQSHLASSGVGDSRTQRLYSREVCWPWYTPSSSSLQFAVSFPTTDSPYGLACVIAGGFHLVDLDPRQGEREVLTTFPLDATPRKIVHDPVTNLLCILTHEDVSSSRSRSPSPAQLLLVHPLTGAILDRHTFASDEVPSAILVWRHKTKQRFIVVGTTTLTSATSVKPVTSAGAVVCFAIDTAPPAAAMMVDITPAAPTPSTTSAMDCSESASSSSAPAATAAASSSSSAAASPLCHPRLRRAMALINVTTREPYSLNSGVCALAVFNAAFLLFSVGTRIGMARINPDAALAPISFSDPVGRVRHLDVTAHAGEYVIAASDEKGGVTYLDSKKIGSKAYMPIRQSDPYGRLARQAVLFRSVAELEQVEDGAARPSLSSSAVVQLNQLKLTARKAGSALTSPGSTIVLRTLGFDAFGSLFLLRREPQPEVVKLSPAAAAPSSTAAAAPAASSAPSAASTTSVPPPVPSFDPPSPLVQECSFLLPSLPSRIRQVRTAPLAPLKVVVAAAAVAAKSDPMDTDASPAPASSSLSGPGSSTPAAEVEVSSSDAFLVSSRLGSLHLVREVPSIDHGWLVALQAALSRSPHTRSMVASHQSSYRGGDLADGSDLMLDGEQLAAFFLLTHAQQQAMCATIPDLRGVPTWKIDAHLQQLLQWQP